jgi:hypothetical protein
LMLKSASRFIYMGRRHPQLTAVRRRVLASLLWDEVPDCSIS